MGDVKQKIKQRKINFKKDIEVEIKELILNMLQVDPRKRPNVSDILKIPFIQNFNQRIDDQFFSNPTFKSGNQITKDRLTKKKNIRQGVNKISGKSFSNINQSSFTMSNSNIFFYKYFS